MRPGRHPSRRRAGGFTLVEVLVAMTIMSVIAIMSWQGVSGMVRSREISQARLEKLLRMNSVLAQWEQDLDAIERTPVRGVKFIDFDGASLRLTRRTPDGLQRVVWSLRKGTLQRWAGPSVTTVFALKKSAADGEQLLGNEAGQLNLLSGISGWQLRYYVGSTWTNPTNSGNDDPRGIQIWLTFDGSEELSGQVMREVAMQVAR